jgi:hypothetical protein
MMRDYYQPWLAEMPEEREDFFFLERQPISVSHRYGQKSRIDPPGSISGRQAMARNHDMAFIRRFTFATAVHVR